MKRRLTAATLLAFLLSLPFLVHWCSKDQPTFKETCESKCRGLHYRIVPDRRNLPVINGKTVPAVCECY